MVTTVVKNLAMAPARPCTSWPLRPPLLIELELEPVGEHKMLIGELAKTATHYVFKPHPGPGSRSSLRSAACRPTTMLDRQCGVPAFARFEGLLNPTGAVWRIELISPRWPE
jgi:hypothetical protein